MANLQEIQGVNATVNVTLTDGVQTVAVSSGGVILPYQTSRIWVVAFGNVSLAAGTTALTARIRRGTTITGTQVGDSVVKNVAASTDNQIFIMVSEERSNVASVEYSLILLDSAASADGTITQSSILVLVT